MLLLVVVVRFRLVEAHARAGQIDGPSVRVYVPDAYARTCGPTRALLFDCVRRIFLCEI